MKDVERRNRHRQYEEIDDANGMGRQEFVKWKQESGHAGRRRSNEKCRGPAIRVFRREQRGKDNKAGKIPTRLNTTRKRVNAASPVLMSSLPGCNLVCLSSPPTSVSNSRRRLTAALCEREQVGVDLVRVDRGHAVWKAWIDLEGCFLQDFRGHEARGTDRYNLVVVTMHHQYRDVDLLQDFGEVSFRERLNAIIMRFDASQHALQPPVVANAFRNLRGCAGVPVKRQSDVLVELRPVGHESCPKAIEHREGQAVRILLRLQHERRHGAD